MIAFLAIAAGMVIGAALCAGLMIGMVQDRLGERVWWHRVHTREVPPVHWDIAAGGMDPP